MASLRSQTTQSKTLLRGGVEDDGSVGGLSAGDGDLSESLGLGFNVSIFGSVLAKYIEKRRMSCYV